MCELLGMCFARPLSADFTIREFALRSEENADGWGLAWYPDRSIALAKEPLRWGETKYTSFLETYPGLLSTLYIAHVRHKTVGSSPTHADTHPFVRELHGREYCFAHNGTLRGALWEMPSTPFEPVGDTDSEQAFCLLLTELAASGDTLDARESWSWLWKQLLELNTLGKLNCLLSDGRRLFCYHDRNGFKGLHYRNVMLGDHSPRHLEDNQIHVNLEAETTDYGIVVASHPLSPQIWNPVRPGQLLVFADGQLSFASDPCRSPAIPIHFNQDEHIS